MTGERELPGRMRSKFCEEVMAAIVAEAASTGMEWERAGGGSPEVKKPTWRTLGSMTVRGRRRESMGSCVGLVNDRRFCTKIRPRMDFLDKELSRVLVAP